MHYVARMVSRTPRFEKPGVNLSPDYMGSSEFEIPGIYLRSYQAILSEKRQFHYVNIPEHPRGVWVYCLAEDLATVSEILLASMKDRRNFCEPTFLSEALRSPTYTKGQLYVDPPACAWFPVYPYDRQGPMWVAGLTKDDIRGVLTRARNLTPAAPTR